MTYKRVTCVAPVGNEFRKDRSMIRKPKKSVKSQLMELDRLGSRTDAARRKSHQSERGSGG